MKDRDKLRILTDAVAAQELAMVLFTPEEQQILNRGDAILRVIFGGEADIDYGVIERVAPGYMNLVNRISSMQEVIHYQMEGKRPS